MASTRTGVSAHQAHLLDSPRGGDIRRSKSSRRRCSRWPGFIAGPWGIGLRRWVRVGKPPSCRSARVGTRRGGRHLAPLSRPPWRVFFSPFIASFGPCLLEGRPGQPGAGRGRRYRRYAGGKPPPSASDQPSASWLRGYCSIGGNRLLPIYAQLRASETRWWRSQHTGRVHRHSAVPRRPSAMPVEHLPAEKGPVCAPYKEGGPKTGAASFSSFDERSLSNVESGMLVDGGQDMAGCL